MMEVQPWINSAVCLWCRHYSWLLISQTPWQATPSLEMAETQSPVFLVCLTSALILPRELQSHDHMSSTLPLIGLIKYHHMGGGTVSKDKTQSITLRFVVLYLGISHRRRRDNWSSTTQLHMPSPCVSLTTNIPVLSVQMKTRVSL